MPLSDRDYMRKTPPPRRRAWRFDTSGGFNLNPIWALIIINVIVYIVTWVSDDAFYKLGLIPYLLGEKPWTIITSMFTHANFTHILFNMIALFFFGRTLTMLLGSNRFMLIYFVGGLAGNIIFWLVNMSSGVILVGASGAVYAIAGALVVMVPRMRIALWGIIPMPLWVFVVIFLVILSLPSFAGTSVAWQAHFGGLAAGLITGFFFRKRTRFVYY